MRADGEILLKSELIDPTTGSLYQLVRRMSQMAVISKQPIAQDDILVFKSLIEVYKSFYFIFFSCDYCASSIVVYLDIC